jgi:hypothetical protein
MRSPGTLNAALLKFASARSLPYSSPSSENMPVFLLYILSNLKEDLIPA